MNQADIPGNKCRKTAKADQFFSHFYHFVSIFFMYAILFMKMFENKPKKNYEWILRVFWWKDWLSGDYIKTPLQNHSYSLTYQQLISCNNSNHYNWYQIRKATTHIKCQLISDDNWYQIGINQISAFCTTHSSWYQWSINNFICYAGNKRQIFTCLHVYINLSRWICLKIGSTYV